MAIRKGIFKVRNTATGEKDEVMLKTTIEQVEGLDKMINPTGSIIAFAGNTLPDGYLLCDGSQVSRTTYKKLFDVIGTTYGAGDGTTTFTLPNLIDRFLEGSSAAGNYLEAALPNIEGSFAVGGYGSTSGWHGGITGVSGVFTRGDTTKGAVGATDGHSNSAANWVYFNASTSNDIYGKRNTVQPSAVAIKMLIKY